MLTRYKIRLLTFFWLLSFPLHGSFATDVPDGAVISLNTAYRGEISEPDEKDWYQFDVTPNQRFYIVVWADNTFGTHPDGLKDTEIRTYFFNSEAELTAVANTDGPTWANLGYGSLVVLEAIPSTVEGTKKTHVPAPSAVSFYIAQQDLSPETGTYTFKVFVDDIPQNADGSVNYDAGSSTYMFTSAINPPAEATLVAAPGQGASMPDVDVSSEGTEDSGTTDPLDTDTTATEDNASSSENPEPQDTEITIAASGLPTCAQKITLEQAYQGEISSVDGRDWYAFSIEANKRYYIVVWADNTFGTLETGLIDTEVRTYQYQDASQDQVVALSNTDGPTWANLGYGSMIVIEALPASVATTKKSHATAPSEVTFFIAQQDLSPQTGTYTFQVFVDDMPLNADGSYNYAAGSSTYMFTAAISPPKAKDIIAAADICETIEGVEYPSADEMTTEDPNDSSSFQVIEDDWELYPGQTLRLEVAGGEAPYDWGATAGTLTEIATTMPYNLYTAPLLDGRDQVTITDAQNETLKLTITIDAQITPIPKTLPNAPTTVLLSTASEIENAPIRLQTTANETQLTVNFPSYMAPVDLYLLLLTPDGTLLFIDPTHQLTQEMLPYRTFQTHAFQQTASMTGTLADGDYLAGWFLASANGGDLITSLAAPYELGAYAFTETNLPTPPDSPEPEPLTGITSAHNQVRTGVNVSDLVWDDTLAAFAQEWADYLATEKNCQMTHRPRNDYGENIAWASYELSPENVVDLWASEAADYDYATNTCAPSKVCGHYTQLVWADSIAVGCGMSFCADGGTIWVCNYDPPGNYIGQSPY